MTQPDGRLFSDPDPDAARAAFAAQPRALADKRTTVAEAVAKHVHDGDYLAIGGVGGNRNPTAGGHEILPPKKKKPSFSRHTSPPHLPLLWARNPTRRGPN